MNEKQEILYRATSPSEVNKTKKNQENCQFCQKILRPLLGPSVDQFGWGLELNLCMYPSFNPVCVPSQDSRVGVQPDVTTPICQHSNQNQHLRIKIIYFFKV